MAKRKVTVTVDEELLDVLQNEGGNVSALVNVALTEHADRLGRLASCANCSTTGRP
jgi:post-segregation antitoxin (ccd killing protein)